MKLIGKIYTKSNVPPAAIIGKYKKGQIVKKHKGPKKAEFILNPYELHLKLSGITKDGKEVIGDCLIKYDINASSYINSLNELEESVETIEEKLSQEINYDLSGILNNYSSKDIYKEKTKRELDAEIEKNAKISFLKKGIIPYKITSKWQIVQQVIEINDPIFNKYLQESFSELEKHAENIDIETIKKEAKKTANKLTYFTSYFGALRNYVLTKIYETVWSRALLTPGKKLSEYISTAEINNIIKEANNLGLDLLLDQNG